MSFNQQQEQKPLTVKEVFLELLKAENPEKTLILNLFAIQSNELQSFAKEMKETVDKLKDDIIDLKDRLGSLESKIQKKENNK